MQLKSFQKKMGRGNFVIANDNHQLSYSDFMGEWKSQPRLGIIKASYIIGLLQTRNQDFENNILSPSTEYLKHYHSWGIDIFM